MQDPSPDRAPWLDQDQTAWRQSVHHWLREVSETQDLGTILSMVEIKARPWSLVLRVSFERATAYFKACGSNARWEARLLAYLASNWAQQVPPLVAVEEDHAWMLMADRGEPLRASADPALQLDVLKRKLPLYAEMQSQSRSSVASLLELGLPDRSLGRLPELLEALLSTNALQFGRSQEDANRLRASVEERMPALRRVGTWLSASAYAQALDHGDLHTGNLLVKGGHAILCDWGDACITHPFCSLLVTLESILPLIPDADRNRVQAALMEVYLEPWTALASPSTLAVEMHAALWVAHIGRVLDFAHMFQGDDAESCARWKPLIGERLRQWLQAPLPE